MTGNSELKDLLKILVGNESLYAQYLYDQQFAHQGWSEMVSAIEDQPLSALAKSAQLPFSSWLPRAMEGPTPSSAIFYGSLSVRLGVFILLRTHLFWEHQTSIRILIAVLGSTTAIISTGIARVQSSVKSQIAYASIAQFGLIFYRNSCRF